LIKGNISVANIVCRSPEAGIKKQAETKKTKERANEKK
jgi:hypothetical protein